MIEIRREDYGIWYVDMMEHPERYQGKDGGIYGAGIKAEGISVKSIHAGTYGDDLLCR